MLFMFLFTQAVQKMPYMRALSPITTLAVCDLTDVKRYKQWGKTDLSGLVQMDLVGYKNVDVFLKELFTKNETLCSLEQINAQNTNISLETLKRLRMIRVPFFVRNRPQYSNRFGCFVAPILVDISGTQLSKSAAFRHSVIEQPAAPSYPIQYREEFSADWAIAQIIVQANNDEQKVSTL